MPKNPNIKKVLVLGSGPIVIGQAAEFDYAGTQACRALKEEGVEVVLVNSNPATIMTDKDIADHVYIEPLNIASVTQVIQQGVLSSCGDVVVDVVDRQATDKLEVFARRFSQLVIEQHRVAPAAVLHMEAAGHRAYAPEAQLLIEPYGSGIRGHDGVEYQQAVAEPGGRSQRVAHQGFAHAAAARGGGDGVAGVGLVAAAPHVVGVQDVEAEHSPALHGGRGEVLGGEEALRVPGRKLVELREGFAAAHDFVPDGAQALYVPGGVFPYFKHIVLL